MELEDDWSTVLSRRLVCRAWYRVIDPISYTHLTLFPYEDDESAVRVRSQTVELPPSMSRLRPDEWIFEHPGHRFTQHTIVLSIIGFIPGACNLPLLRSAFPNLLVLRLSPDLPSLSFLPYVPFGARTLVFFSSQPRDSDSDPSSSRVLTKQPTFRPGQFNLVWKWTSKHKQLYPDNYPRALSPAVERIVLHTWNLTSVPNLASTYNLPRTLSKHFKEIVIVVPIYIGLKLRPRFIRWDMREAVCNLAAIMNVPRVTYTIVGLEVIKVENYEAKFKAALREALRNRDRACQNPTGKPIKSDDDLCNERATEFMSRVRTMTLIEYVAVGISSSIAIEELQAIPPWELSWFADIGGEKEMPWAFKSAYPDHTVVPEKDCLADRLFEHIAENGFF